MWPAPQTADFLFSLSNVALIVGLALTVVATIGSVWMANVREGYLKRDLAEADQRIAEANAAGEAARSAAADANARALEAALALERYKAPRTLDEEQQRRVVSAVSEFAGQEYSALLSSAAFDARPFWIALDHALRAAGWVRVAPPGPVTGEPPAGVAMAPPEGVTVATSQSRPDLFPAANSLATALNSVGVAATAGVADRPIDERPNVIRIVIGLKPQ
jgi:hypothetical protein